MNPQTIRNFKPTQKIWTHKSINPRKFESTDPSLSTTSISANLDNQVALLLSWSHNFIFLVSLFLLPGMGFWAVANSSGGVGGGSLVRLWFDGSMSWLWCWICLVAGFFFFFLQIFFFNLQIWVFFREPSKRERVRVLERESLG